MLFKFIHGAEYFIGAVQQIVVETVELVG